MSVLPFNPRAVFRRLTALAMVLWLAGAGCLMGCEIVAAAVAGHDASTHSAATHETASAESCPMHSSGGDCCHKAKRKNVRRDTETARTLTPNTSTPAPSRSIPDMSCCPLANRVADAARKVRISDAPLAAENRGLLQALDKAERPANLYALKPQARDRGSTHLRCCVFLI
jgi:hypothetical protein